MHVLIAQVLMCVRVHISGTSKWYVPLKKTGT